MLSHPPEEPAGNHTCRFKFFLATAPSGVGRCSQCRFRGRRCGLGSHLLLARRDHHDHLPAFELGKLLHHNQISQLVSDTRQQGQTQFLVRDLATAKTQGDLAFVALFQKALDIAQFDVVVTIVETALGKKAWAGEVGERAKLQIPAGRFAQPDEIAGLALYLLSDAAQMITGANMVIDGGYSIQ